MKTNKKNQLKYLQSLAPNHFPEWNLFTLRNGIERNDFPEWNLFTLRNGIERKAGSEPWLTINSPYPINPNNQFIKPGTHQAKLLTNRQ
ncbi:MAG: hypothetical protein U9Q63_04200 [Patescibacteria group bacterium]|nr:hypothetical protein [Patescibacteria group bacterium]